MDMLPAILEYGLTGLAAVIVFFAYRLLVHQSKKEESQSAMLKTIKAFMILGIVLAVISGISNYFESTKQQRIADLKSQLETMRDSLRDIEQTTAAERRALNRLVANHFSSRIRQGEGKVEAVPPSEKDTVKCNLLRRAVFQNMRAFEANTKILQSALTHFVDDRGYPELQPCKEDIIGNFSRLMTMRLRWLQDEAIPALAEAQDALSPVTQQELSATVPLPETFIIDAQAFGRPEVTVTVPSRLKAEVRLLEKSLQQ